MRWQNNTLVAPHIEQRRIESWAMWTIPKNEEVINIVNKWEEIAKEEKNLINLPERYKHIHSWKVRETYENPDNPEELLIIATDRISTHDVVHKNLIPWKWKTLTTISKYWFSELEKDERTKDIKTQIVKDATWPEDFPEELKERTIIVKKLKALPIEAIVRLYLYWTALKWYNSETWLLATWEDIWKWLKKCSKLTESMFTPSTKEKTWDVNINFNNMLSNLRTWLDENGYESKNAQELAEEIKRQSILMYDFINSKANEKWIIVWDTKFEFWLDENWNLVVIDEVWTPDSSRFWKKEWLKEWEEPESYDKQKARDEVIEYWKTHPENVDINWKHYWEDKFKGYPIKISDDWVLDCQIRYAKMEVLFS